MEDFYLKIGDEVVLTRHVSNEAISAFADVSGDHSPNHTDEATMADSTYQGRIAHGALLVAYTSACSTAIVERVPNVRATETPVALGYDRVRFVKPVYAGDDIELRYTVKAIDVERRRATSDIVITNQHGDVVCVAEHILKWVA